MKNGRFLWSGTALRAAGIAVMALVLMFTACPTDDGGGGGYYGPDKTALNTAIANAEAAKVPANTSAANVPLGTQWVIQADLDVFNGAITDATLVRNNASASQLQVNTAVTTLDSAIATFNAAKQPGTLILDRGALDAKITEAKTARDSVIVAANAGGAAQGAKWATQDQVNLLQTAITAAEANAPNQGAVDSARSVLDTALTTFNYAVNTTNGPGSKTTGFSPEDFSALFYRAFAAKDAVIESSNGNDVPPTREWVTTSVRNDLIVAIGVAKDLLELGPTPTDTDYLALSNALNTFNNARRSGTVPNRTNLVLAIQSADTARTGVVTAASGDLVPSDSRWVTQAQWDALDTVYTAAAGAATQNEVTQKTADLTNAIATFNAAKAANGFGTAVNGLTISGLGAIYKNGVEADIGVVASMDVDFSSIPRVPGTVTGGSLTVELASLQNGSYYAGFSVDGFIVFISKTKVTFSGRPVSMAYPGDFELLTWSVKGGEIGVYTTTSLNDLIGAMSGHSYDPAFKTFLKNTLAEMLSNYYVNLNFLNVAFYKDAACTQEFSGTDQVGPTTVIYTKFSLAVLVGSSGPSGPSGTETTITITNITINLGGVYNNGDKVGVGVAKTYDGNSLVPSEMGTVTGDSLTVRLTVENSSYYIGFSSDGTNYYIYKNMVPLNGGTITIPYSNGSFDHVMVQQPGGTPGGEPPKMP